MLFYKIKFVLQTYKKQFLYNEEQLATFDSNFVIKKEQGLLDGSLCTLSVINTTIKEEVIVDDLTTHSTVNQELTLGKQPTCELSSKSGVIKEGVPDSASLNSFSVVKPELMLEETDDHSVGKVLYKPYLFISVML